MATDFTQYYNLDKYTADDKPNLRDQYNAAMDKIDLAILSANTNATEAKSATQGFQAQLDLKATKSELNSLSATVAEKAEQDDLDALSALLPAGQFSAQNTIKDALDAKANSTDLNTLATKAELQDEATTRANADTALGNRITALTTKKKMIVIGDSFSSDAQSGTPLWYTYVAKHYNCDVYTTASDGQGFVVGSNNFMTQAVNAFNALNPADVERIYVVGGLNDIRSSSFNTETCRVAVRDLMNYLLVNFPNAKRYLYGPESFPNILNTQWALIQWMQWYSAQLEYEYHDMTLAFQFYNGFFGGKTGSNEHPSAEGQKIMARFILNHGNLDNAIWFANMTFTTATKLNVLLQGTSQDSRCVEFCSMKKLGNNFTFALQLTPEYLDDNSGQLQIVLPYNFGYALRANYSDSSLFDGVQICIPQISQLLDNKIHTGWINASGQMCFNVKTASQTTVDRPITDAASNLKMRILAQFSM